MQSEKEFLNQYRMEDYDRPSVTTDVAAFMMRKEESDGFRKDPSPKLSILLVKRGGHPFKDHWALPGGFYQKGETVEECALREIEEETSVKPVSLFPIGVFSDVGRDPRGWIISNAFVCIISEEEVNTVGGDDASDARWFDVWFDRDEGGKCRLELTCGDIKVTSSLIEKERRFGRTQFETLDNGSFAFDHAKIVATALSSLRDHAKNFDLIFDFLPELFTLTALQRVQETIMNISILPANFRRKVADYVEETDIYETGAGHRPAKLYRRRDPI